MKKKSLFFLLLFFSTNTMAYEEFFKEQIKKIDNNKILIDIISNDPENKDRHFKFAKEISSFYPNKHFRFAFHGEATYYAISNKNIKKYNINNNNFELIYSLSNTEFYLCKSGAKKRNIKISHIENIFNTEYTSSQIILKSKIENYTIVKEPKEIINED